MAHAYTYPARRPLSPPPSRPLLTLQVPAGEPAAVAAPKPAPKLGKSGKKICCACPGEARGLRRGRIHPRAADAIPSPAAGLLTQTPRAPPPCPPSPTDTRKLRDACVVGKGEEACKPEIAAHNACLRLDGFDVPM